MMQSSKKLTAIIILGIAITGLLPLAGYWIFFGRVPTVTPAAARELLARPGANAILLDVREENEFAADHLEGAVNWPSSRIMAITDKTMIPETFSGQTLLLLCRSGIRSVLAARRLRELGRDQVINVRGGLQEWTASANPPCALTFCQRRTASGLESLPFREISRFEQWSTCVAAFGVKPLYMVLSFVLIVIMWRLRSPDLLALRWALIFFLAGEGFCAINYLFFGEDSYLAEYLHSFGMVLTFAFTAWAVFEGLDRRVIRYSDPDQSCAALALCGACIKHQEVPCGLQRIFLLLIPVFAVLSFIPLLAAPVAESYNTLILGAPYNFSHPVIYQVFEIRYCPVVAMLFFMAAFVVLGRDRKDAVAGAKLLFSAGLGFFGFSMFRLILLQVYRDNLTWFVNWEEITELIYIVGVGLALWIFRRRFFPKKGVSSVPDES